MLSFQCWRGRTYGVEALELSAYFSEAGERRGMHLMLVFFVWELGLI